MTEVISTPENVTTTEYFGGCPHCGKNDGYINFGRNHWMVCDKHETRWCVGSNLFSSWRDETEEDWEKNAQRMDGYTEVAPIAPETIECERCGETGLKDCLDINHSLLCQIDGKLTELSDDEVGHVLRFLDKWGFRIEAIGSPFSDSDSAQIPF